MTDDGEVVKRRSRPLWIGLFVFLEIVSLVPLRAIYRAGGGSERSHWGDADYRNTFLVCCIVPVLMVLGIVGARRGWNRGVLTLFGLVGFAWPAFVAWVILQLPKC